MNIQDLKNMLEPLSTIEMPIEVVLIIKDNPYQRTIRVDIEVKVKGVPCYVESIYYKRELDPPSKLIDEKCHEIVRNILSWGLWENYKFIKSRKL